MIRTVKIYRFYIAALLFSGLYLSSCHHRQQSMSFYYWKTSFALDTIEKKALQDNAVKTLYIRYFDVDFAPGDSAPNPVAPIVFDSTALAFQVIPVVFIRNRVFDTLDSAGVMRLCQKTYSLVSGISHSKNILSTEIQFDCDWTDKTKDNYFLFLRQYRLRSKQTIAVTIRLHQVKYPGKTGIPPVDHGVLMYYNMGDINSGTGNSIYEKSIAAKYNPSLKTYPLTLDVALPIFAWGLQIRDGKVIKLLNKMNFLHFENDSNFTMLKKNWYRVKHACFHGGYYFSENDTVKTEHVTEEDLLDIITHINRYSNHRIRDLIFYDLDKENLVLYEKDIFNKIMDHTD